MKILSKEHLKELLSYGEDYSLIYTSSGENGADHWWMKNQKLYSYGQGQGWSDRSPSVYEGEEIGEQINYIWERKKDVETRMNGSQGKEI